MIAKRMEAAEYQPFQQKAAVLNEGLRSMLWERRLMLATWDTGFGFKCYYDPLDTQEKPSLFGRWHDELLPAQEVEDAMEDTCL